MEIVSRVHANNLVKWAKDKPNVLVLSADLTSSTEIDLFRETYPERFLSMGIAEQNMLSFAGGLAREGFIPFVHTFAVFIYRRAYDQIAMSIAYPNLPVRMFGFLPGITTPGGATHQAIEDISIMRSLPNMTILECGDATDVESVLDVAAGVDGPVYIRMLRGEIPRLFDQSEPMKLGQARVLRSGDLQSGIAGAGVLRSRITGSGDLRSGITGSGDLRSGIAGSGDFRSGITGSGDLRSEITSLGKNSLRSETDITILSSGICTEEAMRAVAVLEKRGVSILHLHVSTLKPFDDSTVFEAISSSKFGVITMENHSTIGGLGSIVAEKIAELELAKRLTKIGIRDTFIHGASKQYLMKEYKLDAISLINEVEKMVGESFNIQEDELSKVYIAAVHSMAKPEAL